jgi:chemotaxis protein CheD
MPSGPTIDATVFLHPGELFTSETPASVKTILGSCVAITMRAPRLGLAAMAHCLLPSAGASNCALTETDALRYVDTTIDLMLRRFRGRGAKREELEIKLFGGAGRSDLASYAVGDRNVEAAQSILARYGINVVATATGGRRGMAIVFDTGTGDVFVKRLDYGKELES